MWLHAVKKSWPLYRTEQKSSTFLSVSFFLLYLHFICLPAARPSSAVLWRAGGGFSSLTNVVQIACRMMMGEHLDLGHNLFVVAASLQTILLSVFHSSPSLLCFSGSVKWKSSCLTSFQPWCCGLDPQDGAPRPSPTGCRPRRHCGQQRTHLPAARCCIKRFSYQKEVFLQEIYLLFVVFKHINFLPCKQYNNILGWGRECASAVCSWRWHSMLWYSNGVIHQQAPLKHLDTPAEATPVAMVTSLKVDVCSATVAAEMLSVKTTQLTWICSFVCSVYYCVLIITCSFSYSVNMWKV